MAARYPWTGAKLGGLTSLALRWPALNYNNCVRYATDEDHLHLGILRCFSMFHAPMSIPWAAVLSIEEASFGRMRIDVEGLHIWIRRSIVKDEIELRASMAETASEEAIHTGGAPA